jgi:hypothetical protein
MKGSKIIKGFEHKLYLSVLKDALEFGVSQASVTDRRKEYLNDNPDFPIRVLLISVVSYTESKLGNKWIDKYSGEFQKEFCIFSLLRNAFVHCDGDLNKLHKKKVHKIYNDSEGFHRVDRQAAIEFIKEYEADIRTKNPLKSFYETDSKQNVSLKKYAYGLITGVFSAIIFENAGLIVVEEYTDGP